MSFFDKIPTSTFVIAALTLGLAPFFPEPHVWEKIKMLLAGALSRPIDMFDLVFHGLPWALLVLKLARGDRGQAV
ncbi:MULTISPECIES: RND transporter [Roseobacteraceae]|uniref:RND transporter n=1 Tax=Roseobacteraceae TaxID=2854170 RepID=UPI00125F26B4|nr:MULTISPECIES: RND transporter [Roseobacteraceae]KAB6715315.1 RND transporter [Roseobacter sp. TSBP12]|tara:strand:- start:2105 stop:2329 length:225 start_codon:yes stop_codon:yes gene_type:complete